MMSEFSSCPGVNTGPVIAGIIANKKFAFDLWGDAVNVASRMESTGTPGRIQVNRTTYKLTKGNFEFVKRGQVKVKGKGEMTTYWLIGRPRKLALGRVKSLEIVVEDSDPENQPEENTKRRSF